MLAIYNKEHYSSLISAINAKALYRTGSCIDDDYTSVADNLESISMTLKCVGKSIDDFAVFYIEPKGIIEIEEYLKKVDPSL